MAKFLAPKIKKKLTTMRGEEKKTITFLFYFRDNKSLFATVEVYKNYELWIDEDDLRDKARADEEGGGLKRILFRMSFVTKSLTLILAS